MRSLIIFAAVLSAVSTSSAVLAQAGAASVKTGATLTSSDGKRIGRVYDVEKAADGSVTALVIYNSRIVRIAGSTLSAGEKGVTTSLTRADVGKLK